MSKRQRGSQGLALLLRRRPSLKLTNSSIILLEQANDAVAPNSNEDECVEEVANNDVAQNNAIDNDYESNSSSTRLVDKEEQEFMIRANGDFSVSNLEASGTILPQSNKWLEAVSNMEEEPLVELQSQIEDAEKILEMNPIMTPLLKQDSSYDQEVFPSVSKKKPAVSSFKLLKSNGISKVDSTPIKPTAASISSKRDSNVPQLTVASTSMRMTIICGLLLLV
ncbi:hypothetical protein PIB30_074208 [Stylosanthes scabra]|uniref:Uncharacterized protein n=1 Tax=Stylosanthes scabra TaxID=79078 RepID=A0ABU6SQ19_9FABA|nr:hypothetical protein [Stylosanthes scabra]